MNPRNIFCIALLALSLLTNLVSAQNNWHLINTEVLQARKQLAGKTAKPVIVAVIDSGADTLHTGLKGAFWVNPKDGHMGWSYLGSAKGNIDHENLEVVRLMRKYRNANDTLNTDYEKMAATYWKKKGEAENMLRGTGMFKRVLDAVVLKIGKDSITTEDLIAFQSFDQREQYVVKTALKVMSAEEMDFNIFRRNEVNDAYDHYKNQLAYDLNLDYNPRDIVGDHPDDPTETNYGSPDSQGPSPMHGTHVSGIIRSIDPSLILMEVRAVPDGDERDKDVANAIRYATDNGARVINMSFGKGYSPDKKVVDDAVRYAAAHDVLLVHAAGNDHANNDSAGNFPNARFLDGSIADNWIEVGASTKNNEKADFSNYGKNSVDLFAPGTDIYSTLPGNKFGLESGTSMASPVVAGIAAELRSYFPKLKAVEIKQLLMKSVTPVPALAPYCVSGGVADLNNAVKMAK